MVLSSHSLNGFFKVKSYSGETAHFHKFKNVYLRKNTSYEFFVIEKVLETGKALLMKVYDINTPEKVKDYAGCEIWVESKYASPLGKDEYYLRDICRCDVLYGNKIIGHVRSVYNANHADLLEILNADGKIIMIPFQDHFVGNVDIELRQIHLREDFLFE